MFEATNIFILTKIQKKPRRKPCGFFDVYDGGNGVFLSIKKRSHVAATDKPNGAAAVSQDDALDIFTSHTSTKIKLRLGGRILVRSQVRVRQGG